MSQQSLPNLPPPPSMPQQGGGFQMPQQYQQAPQMPPGGFQVQPPPLPPGGFQQQAPQMPQQQAPQMPQQQAPQMPQQQAPQMPQQQAGYAQQQNVPPPQVIESALSGNDDATTKGKGKGASKPRATTATKRSYKEELLIACASAGLPVTEAMAYLNLSVA